MSDLTVGDTVVVSAFTSPSSIGVVWRVTGPAVFVVRPDSVSTSVTTPTQRVTIRGTSPGDARLTAVLGFDSASVNFRVVERAPVIP